MHRVGSAGNASSSSRPRKEKRLTYVLNASDDTKHSAGLNSLAILKSVGPNGCDHLFTGSRDGTLKRWALGDDAATCSATFESHVDWVNDGVLLGDSTLVSCSSDTTLKTWNCLSDGACLKTLRQHTDYVTCLAAAENNSNVVASGGLGGEVFVWDIEAASTPVSKSNEGTEDSCSNGINGNAHTLPITSLRTIGSSNSIASHATPSHGVVAAKGHKESVYALAMDDSGKLLVSGGTEKVVRVWDPRTGSKKMKLRGHTDNIRALLLDSTGRFCLSGSSDSMIRLWDLGQQRCVHSYAVHTDSVWALASTPSFSHVYSGGKDLSLYLTDLSTRESIMLCTEEHPILRLALHDDDIWVATTDSSVHKWPAEGHTPQKVFQRGGSFLAGNLSFSRARASMEGSNPVPVYKEPSLTIPGTPAIVQHEILNNRRHVLTKDTADSVKLWEITKGVVVKDYGKASFGEKKEELFEMVSIPPWFTVDTRLGSLSIHLETPQCFSAEMYSADLGIPGKAEDDKAKAEVIVFEAECIEKGIVDLISKKSITALVMEASADNRYRAGMSQLRSEKWLYVMPEAPAFRHICFVCNGNLIRCWGGVLKPTDPDQESGERRFPHHLPGKSLGNYLYDIIEKLMAKVDSLRIAEKESTVEATRKHSEVLQELRVVVTQNEKYKKEIDDMEIELDIFKTQNDEYKKELDDLNIELAKAETRNYEYKKELDDLEIELAKVETQNDKYKKEIDELEFKLDNVIETQKNEHEVRLFNLYIELDNVKTENKKREKQLDNLYIELNNVETHNKEHEEELDDLYIELNDVKTQNKVYEEERGDLETKLNNALLEIDLLMKQLAQYEHTAPQVSRFFADFTYMEILEATDHFSSSRKIGEGGYGNTYKGLLRRTQVAIKVLSSDSLQGPQEFRQEADTLGRLRHPNIVTLIGVCSEASALIYEYLPNGSLEDRLSCKNNTPPLTWKTRTCIAAELCSALMFMHSCQPKSIIHGDLKPANILLDAHLSCKLSDFGICRAVKATMFYKTHHPKGTFAYMDPEFTSTGELTPKSDVYSFGVILLQLLTGKPPLGIIHPVQNAMGNGTLKAVLDPSAGDWPYLQANQLARLGLRCCDRQRTNRPDLEVGAWRVLEPMKISAGCSPSSNLVPPPYFVCPIVQEVMQDPQVAADGFTYEGEALRGWLDSGHDTSPMTNLILENQTLIPNRALRSAIQDWLQPC